MSDIFFEADAQNPWHWRYWGKDRIEAAQAEVLKAPDHGCVTVGDLEQAAIRLLNAKTSAIRNR